MKRQTHEAVKKKLLKDPKTFNAYKALEEEYQLVNAMLRARKRARLTQQKVAEKMATTTSSISRLESFESKAHHSPSINTLKRYADAVGCVLEIQFAPKETHSH